MAEVLHVALRELFGKRRVRRLRESGQIPAVLYGHGKESVSLSIPTTEFSTAIRRGTRLVELAGGTTDTALIREVQWDPFGVEVLHADLVRVSADESIETPLSIELRGRAPGTTQGGVVELLVHEVVVECPVTAIPEKLELNINTLELGQSLTAAELVLPPAAKLVTAADQVVVQCIVPFSAEEEEEEVEAVDGSEPEVIGRKEEEEEA